MKKFIEAMNGELVLAARFPDGVEVPIKLEAPREANRGVRGDASLAEQISLSRLSETPSVAASDGCFKPNGRMNSSSSISPGDTTTAIASSTLHNWLEDGRVEEAVPEYGCAHSALGQRGWVTVRR